jgi:Rrf2 family protein
MRALSNKSKYGLAAAYGLTRHYGDGPIPTQTIAEEESIPLSFLRVILVQLRNGGIVESRRGGGTTGYQLARPPAEISVGSVIRLLEGPFEIAPCAGEGPPQRCSSCRDEETCGTRLVMRKMYEAAVEVLDRMTLADMVLEADQARSSKNGHARAMPAGKGRS